MIRVVVAPNAFKQCLSAPQAAQAMADGVKAVNANIDVRTVPVADGGDGTLETLVAVCNGAIYTARVTDPLGRPMDARYGILGDGTTAVVEMAEASGLRLLELDERNALDATTYGTGELIVAALERGARRIIVGVGGSATTDGGCGMAQALGFKLLDDQGQELPPGGGALQRLASIDASGVDRRLDTTSVHVACDVWSPLMGPTGAARLFAPQKGADPNQVEQLERGLARFAEIAQKDLQISVLDIPGGGAAGGLCAGLCAFLGAISVKGAKLVLEEVNFDEKVKGADLVLTGEGALDTQSWLGKAPVAVAQHAKIYGLPVVALVGTRDTMIHEVHEHGVDAVFSIAPGPVTRRESMDNVQRYLRDATEQVVRLFLVAGRLSPGEVL